MRSQRQSAYSALLAFRPDKPGPEAVAVIGSNLASRWGRGVMSGASGMEGACVRAVLRAASRGWLHVAHAHALTWMLCRCWLHTQGAPLLPHVWRPADHTE
jgi:hypothetical protein